MHLRYSSGKFIRLSALCAVQIAWRRTVHSSLPVHVSLHMGSAGWCYEVIFAGIYMILVYTLLSTVDLWKIVWNIWYELWNEKRKLSSPGQIFLLQGPRATICLLLLYMLLNIKSIWVTTGQNSYSPPNTHTWCVPVHTYSSQNLHRITTMVE